MFRNILHCDASLPGRIEQYAFQIQQQKQSVWSTDPPKVLADVVEALIGVAHIEGGLELGCKAAKAAIGSMLSSMKDLSENGQINEKLLLSITHPVQAITEICPAIKVRDCSMINYGNKSTSLLWYGESWDRCLDDFVGGVGQISCYGMNLCSVAHANSRKVAKMKSSSLLFGVLTYSEECRSKLEIMTKALAENKEQT